MKKVFFIIALLGAGIASNAQNIICTRPANDSNGKVLTMEETILSRRLHPKWADHRWENPAECEFPKTIAKGRDLYIVRNAGIQSSSQRAPTAYMANLRRWEMYMAQRGYIVYVQDNRGTLNRESCASYAKGGSLRMNTSSFEGRIAQ